ncbi:MAG: DUF5671 domain-containing protein [Candidatus Paceibacterota bacterium]
MENVKTKPIDFFLIIGSMVALYAIVINILNLLFTIINHAYPALDSYYNATSSISFPVAFLIIVFPIFAILEWFLNKNYNDHPEKKDLPIKKWLSYLTLFISGAVIAGSLVTVLYYFLDGRDLTSGFLLKTFSVLIILFLVFGYYISETKDILTSKSKKVWLVSSLVLVILSIVLGFVVIGSPKTQRLKKYDMQKVSDIQQLQSEVVSFWQINGELPKSLPELKDQYGYVSLNQPQSEKPYEYSTLSLKSFEICADFSFKSEKNNLYSRSIIDTKYNYNTPSDWSYDQGRSCFTYVINEDIYKPSVR